MAVTEISGLQNQPSEFNLSGDSRYDTGREYTARLLEGISTANTPEDLRIVVREAKGLASLGLVSTGVVQAIDNFLKVSRNKKIPL
jgi:hypothetical protein